jgi:hypothetical protein
MFQGVNQTLNSLTGYVGRFGDLVDPRGEIGVNSIDDIGYMISRSGDLSIQFGKIRIDLGRSVNEAQVKQLALLQLEVLRNNQGEYYVTYRGLPVQQFAYMR